MSVHDWKTVKLDDIRSPDRYSLVGGPFGSNLVTKDYVEQGVPVIRGVNLSSHLRFTLDDLVFVSEQKADDLLPNNAFPGDVVFTQRGTLGQIGIIPKNCGYKRFVISQSQMKLTVDETRAHPLFVYYYFKSPGTIKRILNLSFSSGVPHINLDILRQFVIELPPLPIQYKIVSILAAFDNLVENNTHHIQTLEKIARTIYNEWFIRFNYPGREDVKVIDTNETSLPIGWKYIPIVELPNTKLLNNNIERFVGKKTYYATANIDGNEIIDEGISVSYEEKPSRAQKKPILNSVWFARMKDTHKVVCFTKHNESIANESILSSGMVGFYTTEIKLGFLYFTISSDEFHNKKDLFCTGATQMALTNESLEFIKIVYPCDDLVDRYGKISLPIINSILLLQQKNKLLRKMRDLLLPKLICGELDISKLDIHTMLMN